MLRWIWVLGLCIVCRQLVSNFATISFRFNKTLRNIQPLTLVLNEKRREAMKLQKKFLSSQVQALPYAKIQVKLDTDDCTLKLDSYYRRNNLIERRSQSCIGSARYQVSNGYTIRHKVNIAPLYVRCHFFERTSIVYDSKSGQIKSHWSGYWIYRTHPEASRDGV